MRNRFIAALRPEDRALLQPALAMAELPRGAQLLAAGGVAEAAFLPCGSALASLVVVLAGGATAQAAICGSEGVVAGGLAGIAGPSPARAVVRIPGTFLRLPAMSLAAASPTLRDMLARHADCVLAQLLQTIACNTFHPLERRLCRWLLAVQERHGGDGVPLTQQYLAELLGAQRTTVTAAAAALQRRGVIRTRRGWIDLPDHKALRQAACGCHDAVRRHCAAVLPAVHGTAR
jgi:CRP-like cAMP-binding protein